MMEGDGLAGLSCSMIKLGGNACEEPSTVGITVANETGSGVNMLACLTPAFVGYNATGEWNETQQETTDVTISSPISMAGLIRAQFTYKAQETPRVTDIAPTSLSAAVSAYIRISGTNFTAASTSALHVPKIRFGSRLCQFTADEFTDATLKCWLPRALGGVPEEPSHAATVWFPAWGFARHSDMALTSEFELWSVYPQQGSHAGGTILTLEGRGFHPLNASKNEVLDLNE